MSDTHRDFFISLCVGLVAGLLFVGGLCWFVFTHL